MRFLIISLLLNASLMAQPKVEEGIINGAKFHIAIPEKWNGSLLLFCHGYSATPTEPKMNALLQPLLQQGYAIAQSGYAAGGWAVEEAIQDTEALRHYFIRKYGKPQQTFVSGQSMGGHLTLALVEKYPEAYDAGLALCGEVAPALLFFKQRAFDSVIQFNYYFPGQLPSPSKIPKTYVRAKGNSDKYRQALATNPEAAKFLTTIADLPSIDVLAQVLDFFAETLGEINARAGGNPFDNRSTLYTGSKDDNALNSGVERLAADSKAAGYLRAYYTPTGQLKRPVLAVQTTWDQLIPAWATNYYPELVEQNGASGLFAQQLVKRGGHCNIRADEIATSFRQLVEWKNGGQKPPTGVVY